jgi:hypothetical protein
MKYFRLRKEVISVGGLGSRIIEDKDPHSENEFENVEELVKKGFLEEVDLEAEEEAKKKAEAQNKR